MSIPRPLVEAYWLGWVPSKKSKPAGIGLDLADIPSATPVNVVKIAFYNLFPNNNLTFCFGMSNQHGWDYTLAGIKALQAAGIKVMASIIGTPSPPVGWNDISDPMGFAQNAKALLIDELGFDGIDVDNEDDNLPNDNFLAVVKALRTTLGPKGNDKALLTYPTYLPWRDLPWLKEVGSEFDWLSTMDYGRDERGQISLWQQYADVVGGENVLIGVALREHQNTTLQTVAEVAQWETQKGLGATGGMMLWHLSQGPLTQSYYDTIRENLTIWRPPVVGGNRHALSENFLSA